MFNPTQAAYAYGEKTALGAFGLTKTAFAIPSGAMTALKTGIRGAKLVASNVPVAGAIINTGLGAAQGLLNGEGAKGALTRGAISGVTGLISSPAIGMAASFAGDMAADKLLAKKPAPTGITSYARGPATGTMSGIAGQGHLPGMVNY